jgi:very-short-patch-repair endonuclease
MGLEIDSPLEPDSLRLERRLGALADRQHGIVSLAGLLGLGFGVHGVYARVRDGRLRRLHRGVYAVGHVRITPEGRALAAVLACGPGAVLSHASAAQRWAIRPSAAAHWDVTVPTQAGRVNRTGVRVHRSRRLDPRDTTRLDGIAITTVARTLLDLADVLERQALKRAADEAAYRRLLDVTALAAVVRRNPGRRGETLLRLVAAPAALTREELEARMWGLIGRHDLPVPLVNHPLHGYEADFLWPEAKLIVELDGCAAHGTRRAFDHDRLRDRRLKLAGYDTIRVTGKHLADESALAADLAALVRSSAG